MTPPFFQKGVRSERGGGDTHKRGCGVELIERLRAWARRYDPRSNERRLMLEAAEALAGVETRIAAEVERRCAERANPITPDGVEAAMGGRKLFPWQRKALGGAE
jgi:hypothetical protein